MMSSFRLEGIPLSIVLQILGKMDFRTASRVRQTSRKMDDLVYKHSKQLQFPVDTTWMEIVFCVVLKRRQLEIMPYLTSCYNPNLIYHHSDVECARFDVFRVIAYDERDFIPTPPQGNILEYIQKGKIKCRKLKVHDSLLGRMDCMQLYRISGASSFTVKYRPDEEDPLPLPFDIIRQLAAMGCQEVCSELCDYFPPDYEKILSKFKRVNIDNVLEERTPSIIPLIKLLLTDPSVPLVAYSSPMYSQTFSEVQINELGLDKWRLNTDGHDYDDAFFIDAYTHYLFILVDEEDFVYYKILKDADQLVAWFVRFVFQDIPVDASVFYEYFHENLDNFEQIKEYLENYGRLDYCK